LLEVEIGKDMVGYIPSKSGNFSGDFLRHTGAKIRKG